MISHSIFQLLMAAKIVWLRNCPPFDNSWLRHCIYPLLLSVSHKSRRNRRGFWPSDVSCGPARGTSAWDLHWDMSSTHLHLQAHIPSCRSRLNDYVFFWSFCCNEPVHFHRDLRLLVNTVLLFYIQSLLTIRFPSKSKLIIPKSYWYIVWISS